MTRLPLVPVAAAVFMLLASVAARSGKGSQPLPGDAMSRAYDSIKVVEPAREATILDNRGDVMVYLTTSPPLRAEDRVTLSLDGHQVREGGETRFELSGLDRGEHTLQSRIVDGNGTLLISSAPVSFYLWRASRLFPSRRRG